MVYSSFKLQRKYDSAQYETCLVNCPLVHQPLPDNAFRGVETLLQGRLTYISVYVIELLKLLKTKCHSTQIQISKEKKRKKPADRFFQVLLNV